MDASFVTPFAGFSDSAGVVKTGSENDVVAKEHGSGLGKAFGTGNRGFSPRKSRSGHLG